MAIGDIFLCRTQYRSHARIWSINQHYRDEAGQDDATASTDLTDAWDATHRANVLSSIATDTSLESIYSVKLTGGDAMPSLDVQASPAGGATGDSLPPNNAIVISLQSTSPTLIRPGRLYVAGIPKNQVTNGNLNAVQLAIHTAVWQAVAGSVLNGAGGDWTPVILRKVAAGVPLVPPVGETITSVRVKPIIYSQRRRTSRQQGVT